MELAGRVFVVARHSDDVSVGRRGFVGDEVENGVTLVFNDRMRFDWDEVGIKATLVFGSSAEKCVVPAKDIVAIFSPDLGVQFMVSPDGGKAIKELSEDAPEVKEPHELDRDGNVIKVDFKKKDLNRLIQAPAKQNLREQKQ